VYNATGITVRVKDKFVEIKGKPFDMLKVMDIVRKYLGDRIGVKIIYKAYGFDMNVIKVDITWNWERR
jgi:hypothetical protein